MNILFNDIPIEQSWLEYQALPAKTWHHNYFCCETGGYVAAHVLKAKDKYKRPGIIAEENACLELAKMGKHVLRLPDNVLNLIDEISIDGKKYRELLKFKPGALKPRGYPDAYFDDQTWDFKTSSFGNEDSLRQTIKDARKADNVIFPLATGEKINLLEKVIYRELGSRKQDGTWVELPNVHCIRDGKLRSIWHK